MHWKAKLLLIGLLFAAGLIAGWRVPFVPELVVSGVESFFADIGSMVDQTMTDAVNALPNSPLVVEVVR